MQRLLPKFTPHGIPRLIRKGTNVLFQGEVPRNVNIIRDGVIREYTIDSNGEERVVALYGKGDIFPLSWALGDTTTTLFYYDAFMDTRLLCLPKQTFLDVAHGDPQIVARLLKYMSNEYTALQLRATGLEQSRALEKIAFTLYYLVFRYGDQVSADEYTIRIRMSQAMLASFVGLTRESTAKNIKTLKEKGVIHYTHSTYTVNKPKLEAFMGEDSFRDMAVNEM